MSAPEDASVQPPQGEAEPPQGEAEPAQREAEPAPPAPAPAAARSLPRALGIALTAAGLLAVTATSAAVTVAVGKPDGRPHPVAAAPAASPSASATATASASTTPSPSASPKPAPKPSSTVHGTVSGGTHGGDIRYFLLPMPDGSESYGSADGTKLSTDDVTQGFSNASEMKSVLDSYNYQDDAAERRYRTADGQEEVQVRLLRFSSHSMAKDFAQNMSFKAGDKFDIDGDGDAQGVMIKPEQQAWTGEMIGLSSVGDIEYEIKVFVKGNPDKALLIDAMKRQRERLATGG